MPIYYILNITCCNRGFFFGLLYVCCAVLHFLEGIKCPWLPVLLCPPQKELFGGVGCEASASVGNKTKVTAKS